MRKNRKLPPRLFYDSQQSAASALGVPIEAIRQAKRAGCEAFQSGRVYVEPLKEWLSKRDRPDHPADQPEDHFDLPPEERWREAGILIMLFLEAVREKAELTFAQYKLLGPLAIMLAEELAQSWGVPWDGQTGEEAAKGTTQIFESVCAAIEKKRRAPKRAG